MKFPVSILATKRRWEDGRMETDTCHGACVVEAISRNEAIGMALRIAHRIYPVEEGWHEHHVTASAPDHVITDPERAFIVSSTP